MGLLVLCCALFGLAGSAWAAAGTISTIAGDGAFGYSGDGGAATSAKLDEPGGVAVDASGDLFIADSSNNVVRIVAAADCSSSCPYGLSSMTKGDVYTVAGDGTAGFLGDRGPATNAELEGPIGVAVDASGNLLIADKYNGRVRMVAAANCFSSCPYGVSAMLAGDIFTIAGNGAYEYSGDGGPATSAALSYPTGVGLDANGNLLIADPYNNAVRLVAAADCSSSCPYGLGSMTKDDIYTVAGNGTNGYSGDGHAATSAELDAPYEVAFDAGGDLLIADASNNAVRLVAAAACSSSCPYGLASMTKGDIYTVAGDGTGGYSGDGGAATGAELNFPSGVAADPGGDLLIADEINNVVRLVAAADCSTACPYGLASMTEGDIYTIAGNGTNAYSGDGGPATSASLYFPTGVGVDAGGDLLIPDTGNNRVRFVIDSVPRVVSGASLSGTAADGQSLHLDFEFSSLSGPLTHSYQWERCSDQAMTLNCVTVGNNSRNYTLSYRDVGDYVTGEVTATDTNGQSMSSTSPADGPIANPSSPSLVSDAMLTGTAQDGQFLHASGYQFSSPDPLAYHYQWERCSDQAMTQNCVNVGTGHGYYLLTSADVGNYVDVAVTAEDREGQTGSSTSTSDGPVGNPQAPVNKTAPSITGTAQQGQVLDAHKGVWKSPDMLAYRFQWERCASDGTGCTPIRYASHNSYLLTSADAGHDIVVRVTATDQESQSTSATSPAVGPVS